MGFGFWEIVVIGFVLMLIFGHRLPGLGRALGRGVVEFKGGLKGEDEPSEAVEPPGQNKPKALDYTRETPQE